MGGGGGGMSGMRTVSTGQGLGALVVVNESNSPIHRVRFSLTSDRSWGDDRLGSSEVLMPGATRTWSVPTGTYNVKIEFGDGTSLDSTNDTYTVTAGGSATCRVTGGSPVR
jgi:hypothetical protein